MTDVAIIGAGPAGLAAAIGLASEGRSVTVLDCGSIGGQAGTSARIENYVGFPDGFNGPDFFKNAAQQARKFNVKLLVAPEYRVTSVYRGRINTLSDLALNASSIIVATGLQVKRLMIPGGGFSYVHYQMDPETSHQHVRGKSVVVVGGGNSAGQAALHFQKHGAFVRMIVRRSIEHTMSAYLIERIMKTSIRLVRGEVEEIGNGGWVSVSGSEMHADLVYVFIGRKPATTFVPDGVDRDVDGYIRVNGNLQTTEPGVFAIGDVVAGSVKRMQCATGHGAMVVPGVHAWLDTRRWV